MQMLMFIFLSSSLVVDFYVFCLSPTELKVLLSCNIFLELFCLYLLAPIGVPYFPFDLLRLSLILPLTPLMLTFLYFLGYYLVVCYWLGGLF